MVNINSQSENPSFSESWKALARLAGYRPRELASMAGVSMRTVQRFFAESCHSSPRVWLRAMQMNEAYRRVADGELIKCVAIDLGFKQLSHFSREFKRVHGVAPKLVQPRTKSGMLNRLQARNSAETLKPVPLPRRAA